MSMPATPTGIPGANAAVAMTEWDGSAYKRITVGAADQIHTDAVDVQANLQQLQYDLQQWNLALTTMTNINKNMGDALNSIASNFR